MVIECQEKIELPAGISPGTAQERIEITLLNGGYISGLQLIKAMRHQKRCGGQLGWICAMLGFINRLDLCRILADHYQLPFLNDVSFMSQNAERDLAATITPEEVTRYQVIPFRRSLGKLEVLTSQPEDEEMLAFLQSRYGDEPIQQIVVTDLDIMKAADIIYRNHILDKSVNGLLNRNPDESASTVFSIRQIGGMFLLFGGMIALLIALLLLRIPLDAQIGLVIFLFFVQTFYLASFLYKTIITIWGFRTIRRKQKSVENAAVQDTRDLPVYTVLIPAYKEANVISTLIDAVKKFDYPQDKLDVILLLEDDDKQTLEAAKKARPPVSWRILVLPDGKPKTKPKALNYGVQFARGEFLTIYDAEDVPEPDQLNKAVAAFRTHSNDYICFQACLNYFNRDQNFLTKMFTLEYSYWFDCLLKGLDSLRLPIPLGGTSNHFDVEKLRAIGAWDPFNVTEDADLGIRAAARGYKVGVIDSTTYEEANSRLGNWLRQRSRWVKGYMQTFIVHNRHPFRAMKAMGFRQWIGYNLLIGGTPALFLLNPIMWTLFFYYLLTGATILDPNSMPAVLYFITTINLVIGNFLVVCLNLIAVIPRKQYNLIPYVFLSPIYWFLQSLGAYKALWQLITRPSYWEKTDHGFGIVSPESCENDIELARRLNNYSQPLFKPVISISRSSLRG